MVWFGVLEAVTVDSFLQLSPLQYLFCQLFHFCYQQIYFCQSIILEDKIGDEEINSLKLDTLVYYREIKKVV